MRGSSSARSARTRRVGCRTELGVRLADERPLAQAVPLGAALAGEPVGAVDAGMAGQAGAPGAEAGHFPAAARPRATAADGRRRPARAGADEAASDQNRDR